MDGMGYVGEVVWVGAIRGMVDTDRTWCWEHWEPVVGAQGKLAIGGGISDWEGN